MSLLLVTLVILVILFPRVIATNHIQFPQAKIHLTTLAMTLEVNNDCEVM